MARQGRWVDTLVDRSVADGAQGVDDLFNAIAEVDTRGWTITRVIGELWLASTSVAGAWGHGHLDIGLGVLSRELVAMGGYPDPNEETDLPVRGWMFRARCAVAQNGTGTLIHTRCVWDTRAQRKVDTGRFYIMYNHTMSFGTTFTCHVMGLVRTLVLLP